MTEQVSNLAIPFLASGSPGLQYQRACVESASGDSRTGDKEISEYLSEQISSLGYLCWGLLIFWSPVIDLSRDC